VILVVVFLSVLFQAIQTLTRLQAVESERDKWQRPSEVLQTLNLKTGNVVVDFGSGVGYFTLKLARAVGDHGRVLAVDIRPLPLLFLRARAFLQSQDNIVIVRADPRDPRLPTPVDGVLIANTYHELTDSRTVLASLCRSLVSGGRLVIVDRGLRLAPSDTRNTRESEKQHHELSCAFVEAEVRQSGFEIVAEMMLLFRRPVTRYGGFLWPASHSYGFSDKGQLVVTVTLMASRMGSRASDLGIAFPNTSKGRQM
jgi:predicted methyltransferase